MENVPVCLACTTDLHPDGWNYYCSCCCCWCCCCIMLMMGWHKLKEYILPACGRRARYHFHCPQLTQFNFYVQRCQCVHWALFSVHFILNEFSFLHYSICLHRMRIVLVFIDAHILSSDLYFWTFFSSSR